MKLRTLVVVMAVMMVFVFVGSGFAKVSMDDTQMLGEVTKVSGDKITIKTIGERTPQTFEFNVLDNALIMENSKGKILKLSDIKRGTIVNINCWRKGNSLYARMIWVETEEDYLTKAILKDAKQGKYYKEIEP